MLRRTALVLLLPLSFALGCGGGAPAPASTPEGPQQAPPASDGTRGVQWLPENPADAPSPEKSAEKQKEEGGGRAPGRAAVADAPIVTQITPEDILALVNKSSEAFSRCQTLGAGARKSWRATVNIKATVSPLGAVTAIEVLSSTAKNPRVDACVIDAFGKLTFTRPAGSATAVFTFPMQFEPTAP